MDWALTIPFSVTINSWNSQNVLPIFSNIITTKPSTNPSPSIIIPQTTRKEVDDWKYTPKTSTGSIYSIGSGGLYGGYGGGIGYSYSAATYSSGLGSSGASYSSSSNIGYSTGGAKDINNFRENIENDYLPIPTDIHLPTGRVIL